MPEILTSCTTAASSDSKQMLHLPCWNRWNLKMNSEGCRDTVRKRSEFRQSNFVVKILVPKNCQITGASFGAQCLESSYTCLSLSETWQFSYWVSRACYFLKDWSPGSTPNCKCHEGVQKLPCKTSCDKNLVKLNPPWIQSKRETILGSIFRSETLQLEYSLLWDAFFLQFKSQVYCQFKKKGLEEEGRVRSDHPRQREGTLNALNPS